MKTRKLILLMVISTFLVGFKKYDTKENLVTSKGYSQFINLIKTQRYKNNVEKDKDNKLEIEKPDTKEPEAVFASNILSEDVRKKVTGVSYIQNNKIKLDDLAHVQVSYWGFDGEEHTGEIIVNSLVAEDVVEIFKELYDAKFPIEKIKLIDEYGASDELSMKDNNTSAFCYREIAGSKGVLSNHSYGVAIDINPIQNPYVKGKLILPKEGKDYLNRNNIRKGMIVKGDVCYNAFKKRGWTWGGEWKALKDYQHFEIKLPK